MKCNDIKSLAMKYELGEADYFEQKTFERHVKKCDKCRRKYKEVLLLSALLYSSKKVFSPTIASQLAKTLPVKIIGAFLLMTIAAIPVYQAITSSGNKTVEKLTVSEALETEEVVEQGLTVEESVAGSEEDDVPQASIRSIYNDREIKYNINIENMKIEGRQEN